MSDNKSNNTLLSTHMIIITMKQQPYDYADNNAINHDNNSDTTHTIRTLVIWQQQQCNKQT